MCIRDSLGGREASTLKDISENWLGKATISMQTEMCIRDRPRAKYKAEHEAELKQFYAARRKLTGEFPAGKVDMKKLSAEYDELAQAHETTYGEFKTVRDDLHRLWRVKSCVRCV